MIYSTNLTVICVIRLYHFKYNPTALESRYYRNVPVINHFIYYFTAGLSTFLATAYPARPLNL